MQASPMISVIVTCYNKGPWIGECIRSILAQNVQSIELIVMDDASTDQSAEVIEALRAQDKRMRVVTHEENQGIVSTWREAVDLARGSYIARCDGDDYWRTEDKLERQLQALQNSGSLWCNCDFDMIDEGGGLLLEHCFENGSMPLADTFEKMLATRGFTNASTWLTDADFMRAATHDMGEKISDDTFDLQLWMHLRTKLVTVPDALVACRVVHSSDTHQPRGGLLERSQRLMRQQQHYLHVALEAPDANEPYPRREVDIPSLLEALVGEQEKLNETAIGRDERLAQLEGEVESMRQERDGLRHELDSVYSSKRWRFASRIASTIGR